MRMVPIPEKARDLFEKPIICALATLMPDGQPQVNPVWCDYDGQYVLINTARGRGKDRNMSKRATVTVILFDPFVVNHWLQVRGHIADVTAEAPPEHIHNIAPKSHRT